MTGWFTASSATRQRTSRWTMMGRLLSVFGMRGIASMCLLSMACAHGNVTQAARVGDANTKIVGVLWPSEVTQPLTSSAWRKSPWFRDEDVVTPSRVVIATDRSACIMRDGDVSQPRATETFTCQDGWRYPRYR